MFRRVAIAAFLTAWLPLAQAQLPQPVAEGRVVGLMAQLYQVRSAESWGVGDLGDLADRDVAHVDVLEEPASRRGGVGATREPAHIGQDPRGGLEMVEKSEVAKLRKELAVERMEKDVLKKATAYFARESLPGTRS